MLLVTGGAGFIGSNVVASLNEAGRTDIAVNDILGIGQKWRNLAGRRLAEFVPAGELLRWLEGRKLDAVVHMGAISSTTENNVDLLMENRMQLAVLRCLFCRRGNGGLCDRRDGCRFARLAVELMRRQSPDSGDSRVPVRRASRRKTSR